MADVPDRDSKESALAAAIEKELARFGRLLARTIPGLQSALERINPELWNEHTANMTSAMSPLLQQTYTEQGAAEMAEIPYLGIDWGMYNQAAANWARNYTSEIVTKLYGTSERLVREAVANYFELGWTQGELRAELIRGGFGPARAETIAVTETTRASVEGRREIENRLTYDDGVETRAIWLTRNDEIVCRICGPRHEKEIKPGNETQGKYPPAHPRCRCDYGIEIV